MSPPPLRAPPPPLPQRARSERWAEVFAAEERRFAAEEAQRAAGAGAGGGAGGAPQRSFRSMLGLGADHQPDRPEMEAEGGGEEEEEGGEGEACALRLTPAQRSAVVSARAERRLDELLGPAPPPPPAPKGGCGPASLLLLPSPLCPPVFSFSLFVFCTSLRAGALQRLEQSGSVGWQKAWGTTCRRRAQRAWQALHGTATACPPAPAAARLWALSSAIRQALRPPWTPCPSQSLPSSATTPGLLASQIPWPTRTLPGLPRTLRAAGIYIHGNVGSGKSLLMDLLYTTVAQPGPAPAYGEASLAGAAGAAPSGPPSVLPYHRRLHFNSALLVGGGRK